MAKMAYKGRTQKYNRLVSIGFLPDEARELSTRSRYALTAPPYMKHLIRSRRRIKANAERYGWTREQYDNYIIDKYRQLPDGIYQGHPTIKDGTLNLWAMIRDLEDKSKERGEEYESPWRKDYKKNMSSKKNKKRVTRKDMQESIIAKLKAKISRTANQYRREQLEEELFAEEQRLRQMQSSSNN